jgi:hypothetical protein
MTPHGIERKRETKPHWPAELSEEGKNKVHQNERKILEHYVSKQRRDRKKEG